MKRFCRFLLGSLVVLLLLIGFNYVQAAETEVGTKPLVITAPVGGLPVIDTSLVISDTAEKVNSFSWNSVVSALKKAATRTYSSLLRRYLNQIAQETAVYVANGAKGQKPTFYNWTWDKWSKDLAGNAAGTYLENFFTAVQEGSGSIATKEIIVTCDQDTIKIKNDTVADNSAWFDQNNESWNNLFYSKNDGPQTMRLEELDVNSECYGKIEKAIDNLDKGGGTNTGSTNNGVNVDKYLGKGFDICQPSSMMVAFRVGLGIDTANVDNGGTICNATDMFGSQGSWAKAIQESVNNQVNYLKNVQGIFDPRANDIGIAFSLQSQQGTYVQGEVKAQEQQRTEDNGAIRNTDAGGHILELPGNLNIKLTSQQNLSDNAFLSQTGDALVDAANLFISVLSTKFYDKKMQELMKLLADQGDKGSSNGTQLADFYSSGSFGQAESEALLAPITDMNFGAGHDLDLLNNLASCPDAANPGPMNCVVNNNFVQAVSQGLTVGEALQKNFLNPNSRFGSAKSDSGLNIESGDISWRAMKILRKYRILPVSWEVAAEKLANTGIQEKKITIGDMVNCYNPSDKYTGYSQEWCRGLIDPNWPLQAPLSYCAKSGFGNQIDYIDVLTTDVAATGSVPASLSTINLLRSSNYCADEQSCLKESDNNRCQLYGYCTEDRRVWEFPSNTCQPHFNTCQTYTNSQGQKTAYLANTLDYGATSSACNADNSGCAAYCGDYNWASSSYGCTPGNDTNKYYLSARADSCGADQVGCSQLIRLNGINGVNLLFNSDFETSRAGATSSANKLDNWFFTPGVSATIATSEEQVYSGQQSLKISSNSVGSSASSSGLISYDWSRPTQSSLPKNFLMRPGVSYTLSAFVYTNSRPVTIAIGNGNLGLNSDLWVKRTSDQINSWQKLSITINNDQYYNANAIAIYGDGQGIFYVDNIMLEIADQGNQGYNQYRQTGYTYEKLLPEYLRSACYFQVGDSLIKKSDAPAECDNYARTCLPQEADCKLFTNQLTGDQIPAKTNLQNYCPASCVGFASFWQQATVFANDQEKQLIPKSAQVCSEASVGCTEFTNLSNSTVSGENKEYFKYLRQCVKPDEPQANCAEFYIWQNTAATGLQLKSYTWQADSDGSPKLTNGQSKNPCTISSIQSNSPYYNADCREIRNQNGDVSYVPYSETITCDAGCQTYRLSENNTQVDIANESACDNYNGHWLASKAECVVCRGNGQWDTNNQACIYRGLPAESSICSADQNGCRLYSGTGAANWRLVSNYNFDSGVTDWLAAATSSDTIRTTGYSLITNNNYAQANLGTNSLNDDAKYRLQFFAKANSRSVSLSKISLRAGNQDVASFNLPANGIQLSTNDWHFYSVDISKAINLNTDNDSNLYLVGNGRFLIDEVRLMEVNDEYYLLKNSLKVPSSCNQDYNGSPAQGFMLGCQEYKDNNDNTHYLHGFTDLCQESAVGCEAMINTHNYTNYYYPFQPKNGVSEIINKDIVQDITPADEIIYAVYDRSKLCSNTDKGCQQLGREKTYQDQATYETTYLKVDPDRYRSSAASPIKCSASEVGCQTWVSDTSGLNFFKDPGDQLCEWKAGADDTNFAWYKRPVKYCSQTPTSAPRLCATSQDCSGISSTSQCVANQDLIPCPVNHEVGKTIGLGGDLVRQPIKDNQGQNWAGLCPATQSGCTEYLDPLSRVNSNIITLKPTSTAYLQSVPLQAFTTYVLQVKADSEIAASNINWKIGDGNLPFWILSSQNKLLAASSSQNLAVDKYSQNKTNSSADGFYGSATFMTNGATTLTIDITAAAVDKIQDLSARPMIIGYQLNQNLASTECTDNKTNYDQGCLLFNERAFQQNNYSSLLYNTDLSSNDTNGISPQSLNNKNNANRLIKVKPSRTCGKWLECTTYTSVKQSDGSISKVCTAFGLCDSLDAYNNCAHFIDMPTTPANQSVGANLSVDQIRNMTGYSKVGYSNSGYSNDFYNLVAMSEQGKGVDDFNGSFESVTPVNQGLNADEGHLTYSYTANKWSNNSLSTVIVSPQQAITVDKAFENNYLPPDGNNFLRLATTYQTDSNSIYGYIKTGLIKVGASTAYNLNSAIMTTGGGGAGFTIWEYTCDNPSTSASCVPAGATSNITHNLRFPNTDGQWQNKMLSFTSKANTKYIQIELDAFNENGIAYFDNVQIKPSLAYRAIGSNSQLVAPSCRLYPEGNSLSCDYQSASNQVVRKKGLMGYCLEYDPANNDNCLLWYPLDKIAADPVEEGVGYNGKRPLYYCLEATTSLKLEYRHAFQLNETADGSGDTGCVGDCPEGYYNWKCRGDNTNDDQRRICAPSCTGQIIPVNHSDRLGYSKGDKYDTDLEHHCDGWYQYNGNLMDYTSFDNSSNNTNPKGYLLMQKNIDGINNHTSSQSAMFCGYYGGAWDDTQEQCNKDGQAIYIKGEIYRDQFAVNVTSNNNNIPSLSPIYCTKFVKVVNDNGDNKFWADRVKEGSAFQMPCYIPNESGTGFTSTTCAFGQSSVPFASIGYPVGQGAEPEIWDSLATSSSPANQPLFYQDAAIGIHLGKLYSANPGSEANPKYLFAQSYGSFDWQFDAGKGADGHDYFADSGHYVANSTTWGIPTTACPSTQRPAGNTTASFCLIKPVIDNVRINDLPIVGNIGQVVNFDNPVFNLNLTFNSRVDSSQRPLRHIVVDWGDGSPKYDRIGNFIDRYDVAAPHQFTHRYSCQADSSGCGVNTVTITLTDNWNASSTFSFGIRPRAIAE